MHVRIELGPDGARRGAGRGDIVVVIDVLRMSSTVVAALTAGARSVLPVEDASQCAGVLSAGESDGVKLEAADFGNSPTTLVASPRLVDDRLVLCTTNGARCSVAAAGASMMVIACAVNLSAAARWTAAMARDRGAEITLVVAGWKGDDAIEDRVVAYAFESVLGGRWLTEAERAEIGRQIVASPAADRLRRLAYDDDIDWCARVDAVPLVPVLGSDGAFYSAFDDTT